MKKKIIALMLTGLFLVGCGKQVKKDEPKQTEQKTEKKEEKKEETSKEEKTTEENGMKKTIVFTNKELNKKGKAGSINYNFSKIQVSKLIATTDTAAKMLQIEKGKEFTVVAIDVEAENTEDKDVNFFISQAKLISNTKEQLEPNMLTSKHIDGEFLGKVKKDGTNVYLLKNTKAEDLKSIEIRLNAPIDKNFNKLSEDIKLTIELKK